MEAYQNEGQADKPHDPMVLCRWCGILVKSGRGEIKFVPNCSICSSEIAGVPCED